MRFLDNPELLILLCYSFLSITPFSTLNTDYELFFSFAVLTKMCMNNDYNIDNLVSFIVEWFISVVIN